MTPKIFCCFVITATKQQYFIMIISILVINGFSYILLPIYAIKKSGHQKGYINNYTNSHHVHSVASSQYAHYQVHPDISVTAQQKVHHRNNNSPERAARVPVNSSSKTSSYSRRRSGRCTRSTVIRQTSLAKRVHVNIVGSQRRVLCKLSSGHPSSPEIH